MTIKISKAIFRIHFWFTHQNKTVKHTTKIHNPHKSQPHKGKRQPRNATLVIESGLRQIRKRQRRHIADMHNNTKSSQVLVRGSKSAVRGRNNGDCELLNRRLMARFNRFNC